MKHTTSFNKSFIAVIIRLTTSAFLFIPGRAEGQHTQLYRMEQAKEGNLWLYGQNPVGLAFGIPDHFSVAEGTYEWRQGDLKQVYEPVSKHIYQVQVQSFQRLKQTAIYGKAGYSGEIRNQQQWTAIFRPQAHSVLFGDSIPGRTTGESYLLTGSIAIPIGQHWTVGAAAGWQVSNRAKDTDPRSLNNNTRLHLMPGIALETGNLQIGLSALWQKNDEEIDYTSVGEEIKNGRTYYPLWFYTEEQFTGGSNPYRYYRQHIAGAAIQFGCKGKDWVAFCEAGYKSGNEQIEVNRSIRLSAGESENKELHFHSRAVYANRHTFTHTFSRKKQTGYNLQQQLPQGELVYETVHRVKRSAQTHLHASLAYELRSALPGWKVSFSIAAERRKTLFLIYPVKFSQELTRHACTAGYERHSSRKRHLFDYGAELRFSAGSGTPLSATTSDNVPLPEITLRQNTMLLTQEYEYLTASRTNLLLHFQYTRLLRAITLYTRLCSGYEQSSGRTPSSRLQNSGIRLSAGITF